MSELFDISFVPQKAAVLSPCGNYRYTLSRQWDNGQCVAFLMFNPSTADASVDDATIRKCKGFAQRWGYTRMVVANLFAIRNRDPKAVGRTVDPIGPMNDYYILEALKDAREVICAWGCGSHMRGPLLDRPPSLMKKIRERYKYMPIQCLGRGQDGNPKHPLMLAYTTEREPFLRPT